MSGTETVIEDEILAPWFVESGSVSFVADEGENLVAAASIFTTNLVQLTRVSPFIAVGESPHLRFSIRVSTLRSDYNKSRPTRLRCEIKPHRFSSSSFGCV